MQLIRVNYWDGTSDSLTKADAIHIDGSRIRTVGKQDRSEVLADCDGLTLIPGLIDAHVHMCLDPDVKDPLAHDLLAPEIHIEQMLERAKQMLLAGITTARDLGGSRWLELEVRDMIHRGEKIGTRLLCAGQPVTSVQGHCHFWGGEADSIDAAIRVVERQVERGVDLIKIMATGGNITPGSSPLNAQFSELEMQAIVQAAKQHGHRVAAHCHGTEGISNAARSGVTTIEHCSWVGEAGWARNYQQDVVETIVANHVWVSPTINAGWQRYVGTREFEGLIRDNYAKMRTAGVKLIASTDAGIPNVRHQDLPKALPVFAHFAGLSSVEVLRAATSDCADALGLGATIGRIAPGFEADLVAYEGNPLEDLSVLSHPVMVIARGRRVL